MTQSEVNDLLEPVWMSLNIVTDELHARVQRLRDWGATWEQIGNYLGVSRQAAQQRFGRLGVR